MDPNVDPCEDFYDFACGNFVKETQIPADKTQVNAFSAIQDKLQEQLRTTFEEPVADNEPAPFKLVKRLYKACMNTSELIFMIKSTWQQKFTFQRGFLYSSYKN
jgi:neprilysin